MNAKMWRAPLALAVILAVSSTLVFWNEFKRKPQVEQKEAQAKKLFQIDQKLVSEIQIQNSAPSKETYTFQCQDLDKLLCKSTDPSAWLITSPVKAQAEKTAVNSFLKALTEISSIERIDLEKETPEKKEELLQQFGVSEKNITAQETKNITIKTQDEKTYTLFFGTKHPMGGNYFVRSKTNDQLESGSVYLVSPEITKNFEHKMTHWRDKTLFSFKLENIDSFQLKNKTGTVNARFENETSSWALSSQNQSIPADSEEIETFLNSIAYLNAKDFAAENKKSAEAQKILQGASELISLKLFFKDKKSTSFRVLQKTSGKDIRVFADISNLDPLYEIDVGSQNRFNKSLKDFRQLKLLSNVERFTSKKIIFSNGPLKEPIQLTKTDSSDWLMEGNPKFDTNLFVKLLEKMSAKSITEFHKRSPNAKELASALEVQIFGPEDKLLSHFQFWKNNGKHFALNLLGNKMEILELDASLINLFPVDKTSFDKKPEDKK